MQINREIALAAVSRDKLCYLEAKKNVLNIFCFNFSEIRKNQVPGDCLKECCRDLCLGS